MIGFGVLPWQLRGDAAYQAGGDGVHRLVSVPHSSRKRMLNFWLPICLAFPLGGAMGLLVFALGAGSVLSPLFGFGFAFIMIIVALTWDADSKSDTPAGVVLAEIDLNHGRVYLGLGEQSIEGLPTDGRWVTFGLGSHQRPMLLREFVLYLAQQDADSPTGFAVFWQVNSFAPTDALEQFCAACDIPFRAEREAVRASSPLS